MDKSMLKKVYICQLDMPLSLLEAMSYGNCCLVSDIPGAQRLWKIGMNC